MLVILRLCLGPLELLRCDGDCTSLIIALAARLCAWKLAGQNFRANCMLPAGPHVYVHVASTLDLGSSAVCKIQVSSEELIP